MLTINNFIQKLTEEFEDYETGEITPESNYRDLKNWSSVHALILMAIAETEYNVTLDVDDLIKSQTVKDIFEIIVAKQKQ